MPESNDLKTAVVSVWQGGVNKGKFAGTAFFISDVLLLTAKHVVQASDPTISYHLGGVQGVTDLPIDAEQIHYHPERDIALIQLAMPVKSQEWVRLDLLRMDYEGRTADIFGFNRFTKAFDPHNTHTIGTADHDKQGYLCDHQVLKGFSGGAVAIDNRVMAIVTQRHPEEQQTRILPLFLVKEWLADINQICKCPVLGKYLSAPASTSDSQEIEIYRTLQELSKFVERPKEAYSTVLNKFQKPKNQVCAYLCLFTNKLEDKPQDYVEALAMKLQEAVDIKESLLDIIENESFEAKNIRYDVWQAESYQTFYDLCLQEILDDLQRNTGQQTEVVEGQAQESVKEQTILQLLASRKKPKVYMLIVREPEKNFLLRWLFAIRFRRFINWRFRWMQQFNQRWQQLTAESNLPYPLVLMFCIGIDSGSLKAVQKNVILKQIHDAELSNWIVFVQNALKFSGYSEGRIFLLTKTYRGDFEEALERQQRKFPLSYRQFKQQINELKDFQ